ncbi:MAG: DUF4252 domain-containing protein [Bacteroidia bacterium]|nr:DUF4252 domain-containing protein [Bacteroidia bacterium]NNF31200.1 DUF4252 domain-containing protein [Flavobacteriaceae bacterium]MBT8274807.1 DUF4252 domain-containing protein [Bacteroidia bacterium]NNJ80621.1 DUF4252 domain-containing protein [Flavobacteriaceae bacterium]NNK54630.1 DUF4252 domain-containing protein [Flavobacteriaceae bacterium]
MVLVRFIVGLSLAAISLVSCADGSSLQRYLVDKQDDDKFLKVDIATSLLESDDADFTEEQKEILETIKKVNVVAFPLKGKNAEDYTAERAELAKILDNEKYVLLGKVSSNGSMMTMKYLGEEDAIDEVIIFASDDERGFAVFRLLGDNMKPGQMLKLMNSINSGDFDVSALNGIGDIFSESGGETDNNTELIDEIAD